MQYFVSMLAVVLVLPIHEWAHAYAAYLLGDHTAKWEGRLSINPAHHLSLWGSLCLILFGFGWAKPVPINPYNFTKIENKKLGFAICAFAGPFANFLMGILYTIIYKFILVFHGSVLFYNMFRYLAVINIYLMVFNLLPVPPLDGSRFWSVFLSDETYNKLMLNEAKITIIVFVLLFFRILDIPLEILSNIILGFIDLITKFIY